MWKSIEEYVFEHAADTPDKTALITKEREVSYLRLADEVSSCAAFLRKKGVDRGSIVIVKSSQTIEYIVLNLGIHLAGGVVTALESTVSADGIVQAAQAVGADVVICDDLSVNERYSGQFLDSRELSFEGDNTGVWKADGGTILFRAGSDGFDFTFPGKAEPGNIYFTTGTTGASKGVEVSHGSLFAVTENLIYGCSYPEEFVHLVPGPLNHANPIRNVAASLVNGNACYILNGMMNMRDFYGALEYPCERVSCCLPPPYVRILFMLSGDKIGEYADKIDFIVSSTAPFPEPDKERLCRLLPSSRLYNSYGSSESGVVCMYSYQEHPGLAGCVGRETRNSQVLIVDDERKEIASSAGHPGLIACRGPINMTGYVNEPELTAQYFQDGTFYTNDIGYKDENGFVYILGRKGDVINVGGLKVAPAEVEEAALTYEGLEDCICVGVEDRITGKALKLLVVLREGMALDKRDLRQYLSSRLELYKVPQFYEQVDQIKRTFNGKLDRKAYRQELM
ncbi:MAG: acyl--CoA ligase [Lachnospiraceae bacterium]|nr:acyl--CoA ligase [Lachnospiraceae bacterium]